jgi:hypothetical protein
MKSRLRLIADFLLPKCCRYVTSIPQIVAFVKHFAMNMRKTPSYFYFPHKCILFTAECLNITKEKMTEHFIVN